MPISLTIVTTKPEDKEWWWTLNPEKMATIESWIRSCPGFISYHKEMINDHARKQVIIFDNVEHYANYLENLYKVPEAAERLAYNAVNKLPSTVQEEII
jgi:hypothetical protein